MSRIFNLFRTHTTDRLHNAVVTRSSIYKGWHEHPYSHHTHWALFFMFLFGWGFGLAFHFLVPPNNTFAATWSTVAVDESSTIAYTSIGLAANGTVGMAYIDTFNDDLIYESCSSSCTNSANWTKETIDTGLGGYTGGAAGTFVSLAFSTNTPSIAYYRNTGGALIYAIKDNSDVNAAACADNAAWDCETLNGFTDGENDRGYIDLKFNGATPALLFGTRFDIAPTYAERVGGTGGACAGDTSWNCQLVGSGDLVWHDTPMALAIVSSAPRVIYYENGGPNLEYGSCSTNCATNGTWTVNVAVDTNTTLGSFVSLTSTGNALHGAYYDETNGNLQYATCDVVSSGNGSCDATSEWTLTSIDTTGNVGQFTDIAVNGSNLGISYYDATNSALKVATCSSTCTTAGNWTLTTVEDTTGTTGKSTSIAIDGSGNAYVSYRNGNDDPAYAVSSPNTAPVVGTPTVSGGALGQATDGTGSFSFSFTVSDADSQTTTVKIEYSDDGGSTWKDPTLSTATVGGESVSVNNGNTYQVGSIATNTGQKTVTVVWGTKSELSDRQTDIQVRATPYDGTDAGTAQASVNFTIDDAAPTLLGSFAAGTPTATTIPLTWTAVTEDSFGHYEVWYGTSQANVMARTATEWDNDPNDAALATISTATTTITGLSVNTQYYFKIWAVDTLGNEMTVGDINTYTAANVPSAPTVNTPTTSSVAVAINVNSNPSSVVFAIQETGGSQYVQANGSLGASAVWQANETWGTVTVTGLSANTSYTFKVKAQNINAVETALSSGTSAYTAVSAPTNFQATTITATSLALSVATFTNDSVGSAGYRFQITSPTTADSGWQSGTATKTFSTLSPNVQYTLSVTYRNGDAVITGSATLQVYTYANVPGAPTVGTATQTSFIVVVDQNSNPSATTYAIQVTPSGGSAQWVQTNGTLGASAVLQAYTTWGGATGVTVTGLTAGISYAVAVKARNGDATDTSLSSSATIATTNPASSNFSALFDQTPPTAPKDFSVTATTDQILLKWTDPLESDTQDSIVLRSEGDLSIGADPYALVRKGLQQFIDTQTKKDVVYNYMLKVTDAAGNFSLSEKKSAQLLSEVVVEKQEEPILVEIEKQEEIKKEPVAEKPLEVVPEEKSINTLPIASVPATQPSPVSPPPPPSQNAEVYTTVAPVSDAVRETFVVASSAFIEQELPGVMERLFSGDSEKSRQWLATYTRAYQYGGYTIEEITQAIRFGGKTVHPTIPASAWRRSGDYNAYINRE